MDVDAVRVLSSRLQQTAESIDSRFSSITQTVASAGWQSQAREEFVMRLESLQRISTQSTTIMRTMAQAADQKADQWETIANVFNGPFYFLAGIWDSVKNFFESIGSSIENSISNIRLPSLPTIVLPSISGAAIIGSISSIIPEWEWNAPSWWPFGKTDETEKGSGGGAGGSSGGSWGSETEEKIEDSEAEVINGNSTTTVSGTSSTVESDKSYPQPPTSPELEEVNGEPSSYTCATYARDRRPDLGSTQSSNEVFEDGAAANYISKFEDKAFQIDTSEEDLNNVIGTGYALVWEPDHPSANDTYGHVAIIEEVYSDHVVISEAARVNGVYQIKTRTISVDQLNNDLVWLIP